MSFIIERAKRGAFLPTIHGSIAGGEVTLERKCRSAG
jgi:hypothetical protein